MIDTIDVRPGEELDMPRLEAYLRANLDGAEGEFGLRQFGGGHGVFSFYLVNGVDGAADSDHDGFVEVKELVDYVSMQVPLATVNTQHPHEYGAYGMYWRLSDLSKPGIELP